MVSERPAALLRTGRPVTLAVVAGGAYFIAALIGLGMRLPPATPSVLWPPNAILTTLLLFVPPARWWSVLLGSAAAHFAVELQVWATSPVALLFLTNSSEALLAAGAMRALSDAPARFDTLRRISIFIVAGGLAAPFVSTFLDAVVVSRFHVEEYWAVWRLRFPSNVLAQLAIVPALAGLLNRSPSGGEAAWGSRREAIGIAAAFLMLAAAISLYGRGTHLAQMPLTPFLPLLLWSAVRFGTTGAALAALGTLLIAVGTAIYGEGVLQGVPPEVRIGLLQSFLIMVIIPLLCLSALVEERVSAHRALAASDALKLSILWSIPSIVTVVDQNGGVVATNQGWVPVLGSNGVGVELPLMRGDALLDAWAAATDDTSSATQTVRHGLRSVLDDSSACFSGEFRWAGRDGERWWAVSIVPLRTLHGGAVISHTDVTARKRAEIEAQRSREELAHVGRVWVMGELTASLSHQLNQPLTAMMGNAQAGLRLLRSDPPDLEEVRHILHDIVADVQRAADVTRAVRNMLRKNATEYEAVDMNALVREAALLVSSDAMIRNVAVHLAAAPSLPPVSGDRIQMRQVLLNLVINGLEAAADASAGGPRTVVVTTERNGEHGVRVAVSDTGRGLRGYTEEQIFEPLFTTKRKGMGMGLPIARAIVEGHGGTISAHDGPGGGAVFEFTIPGSTREHSIAAPR
jgi:signal transduction histidine kinase